MTSKQGAPADRPLLSAFRSASAPKLNAPREAITIQFSALGKEEEDEEEDSCGPSSDPLAHAGSCSEGVVTALEASEDLVLDEETETKPAAAGRQPAKGPASSSGSSGPSPSKSVSLPSMDKAFINLIKSLSTDLEPREGVPAPPSLRHRQLMKNLVKSLSTETTPDASGSTRSSDSRLKLQLFRQFAQHRSAPSTGDSKTAPTSPLPSDSRFSFKVSEVEARLEDTKRRLSEAISDPLHLISKIMGDEASGIYRPKPNAASVSELTSFSALNGHLESNNNYTIEEEDHESEGLVPNAAEHEQASATDGKAPKPCPSSLALDTCSMSALAKQEDEEFCELYSEDFEFCEDSEARPERADDTKAGSRSSASSPSRSTLSESEADSEACDVPYKTLFALTLVIYGCLVLPFPTYLSGMLLGVALGFLMAIGLVWLTGPKRAGIRRLRDRRELWNVAQLDIKEPDIFKGWMNEIQNYDPETYHATLTHSVFVRLEGSALRISKPNKNIARRASYNEPKPDVTYISQKIYNLTDSKVSLVPSGLARKRVWNKKYPIRIELEKQDDFMSKAELDRGCEETSDGETAVVYLFGRTGREKEEWFRRILLASRLKSEAARKTTTGMQAGRIAPALSHSRSSSSLDELFPSQSAKRESVSGRPRPLLDYSTYMANCINHSNATSANTSPQESPHSSPGLGKKLPSSPAKEKEEAPVFWVNALIGRIAWDFLREQHWADWVSKKIQMKLSKIRLPYFMNELTLTELDMGMGTPRILWASQPSVDHQGLWFDVEIAYKGSFLMTLETKMNLSRLGKEGDGPGEFGKEGHRPRAYCLADSDEESSSAGSSDEDDGTENVADKSLASGAEGYAGVHRPSKIMKFVDRLTKNKYFQKATETEFIKKKMEEVSNTPLLLTVELQECKGTLAVNVPPPPTDRIWYGFRSPPLLELKARPKLGEREVTLAHVTDWIEKKLEQEFLKILVMPNMDDVWLTAMHSATDPRSDATPTDTKGVPTAPEADIPTL